MIEFEQQPHAHTEVQIKALRSITDLMNAHQNSVFCIECGARIPTQKCILLIQYKLGRAIAGCWALEGEGAHYMLHYASETCFLLIKFCSGFSCGTEQVQVIIMTTTFINRKHDYITTYL